MKAKRRRESSSWLYLKKCKRGSSCYHCWGRGLQLPGKHIESEKGGGRAQGNGGKVGVLAESGKKRLLLEKLPFFIREKERNGA